MQKGNEFRADRFMDFKHDEGNLSRFRHQILGHSLECVSNNVGLGIRPSGYFELVALFELWMVDMVLRLILVVNLLCVLHPSLRRRRR